MTGYFNRRHVFRKKFAFRASEFDEAMRLPTPMACCVGGERLRRSGTVFAKTPDRWTSYVELRRKCVLLFSSGIL